MMALLFPPYPYGTPVPYRVHLNARLPRWLGRPGVTLGHHILIAGPVLNGWLHAHEYRHVEQWQRWGYLGFLARWLWWSLRHGHATHPIELDSRAFALQYRQNFADLPAAR